MTNIDPKQAERVWSRVMGAPYQQPAAQAMAQSADAGAGTSCLDEKTVSELVSAAASARATYQRLACMTRGCAQKTLQMLANEKSCQIKQLSAIYYILTGKKLCPEPARPDCIACVSEALRDQIAAARQREQRYTALSQCAEAYACQLSQMAKEECRAAEGLYHVLVCCL